MNESEKRIAELARVTADPSSSTKALTAAFLRTLDMTDSTQARIADLLAKPSIVWTSEHTDELATADPTPPPQERSAAERLRQTARLFPSAAHLESDRDGLLRFVFGRVQCPRPMGLWTNTGRVVR